MTLKNYSQTLLFMLTMAFFSTINAQTISDDLEAVADIIVDINGTGDYLSVKDGLKAVPDSSDQWTVVYVKNGTYYEKVVLNHKKTKVVLVGEDVDSTIITYDDHADAVLPGHTFSSYTFRADAHDFQAYNITFENTATQSQAVAFHSNGDRQILYHCKMLSYQDTYFDNFRTRRYIKDCFIAGAVDYIFGFGVTLFDSCQIHTINNGYITAAATPQYYEFGYVFKNCFLTKESGKTFSFFLGRPWFPYSNTIFFECWEHQRVKPSGWETWDGRENTCIYREYNCYGPGAENLSFRASWSSQLDSSLAPRYNIDTIFAITNFPIDSGYVVDSVELWSMRDRFEASGYADRADTILFAGRDQWPEYPTENWSPVFYDSVYSIIRQYKEPFANSIQTNTAIDNLSGENSGVEILNPVNDRLTISSEKNIHSHAKLTLYDINGRKVFEHNLNFISEGLNQISIESANLETGVYLYHIQTDGFQTGGKILKY